MGQSTAVLAPRMRMPPAAMVKREVRVCPLHVAALAGSREGVAGSEKKVGVRSIDALGDGHRWRKNGEKKIGKGERILQLTVYVRANS